MYDIKMCPNGNGISGIHQILNCNSNGMVGYGNYTAIIKNSQNKIIEMDRLKNNYKFLNPKNGKIIDKLPVNYDIAVHFIVGKNEYYHYHIHCIN